MTALVFSLCIFIFIVITTINYLAGRKDVLYPGFLYGLVWVIVFSAYVFSPVDVYDIGFKTVSLLLFGAAAFSLGCYFSKIIDTHSYNLTYGKCSVRRCGIWFLVLYCFIVFPFFCKDILAVSGGGLSSLLDLRNMMVLATKDGGSIYSSVITGSVVMVSISTACIAFIEPNANRHAFYVAVLLSIVYCVLNTGRNSLFALVFGLIAIHLMRKNKTTSFGWAVKKLGIPLILFVSVMMAYMFVNHQTEGEGSFVLANKYLFIYLTGGIPALDTVVNANASNAPHHTFQFFTSISNALFNTRYALPLPLDNFVSVPYPTNVYTVYKFFYQDFGYSGTIIVMSVIGFIHGLVYRFAKIGDKIAIFFYAMLTSPLLLSFFDDTYSDFRGHIRNALVVSFCYILLPTGHALFVWFSKKTKTTSLGTF